MRNRLAALTGWRRNLCAAMLGLLAALALPPFDLVPLLVIAFSGLLWLSEGCRRGREAFVLGWSFGFGFFLLGLYWISSALFTDIAAFWWLVPPALLGFPTGCGISTGLALLLVHAAGRRGPEWGGSAWGGAGRVVALAVAWTAAEWLRGHLLTGFPWNLVGYAWAGWFPGGTAMLQTTSVTGIYGLSLLTVLAAALPALAIALPGFWRAVPVAGAVLLITVPVELGQYRLATTPVGTVPGVRLRLVQPSIPQTMKWDAKAAEANFQLLLSLSAGPGAGRITDVVWPEAAATYLLSRDAPHRAAMAAVAPKGGLIITGSVRANDGPAPVQEFWNSLLALNGSGDIVGRYDKFHLVPFGEYVPLRGLVPIPAIAANVDFNVGPGPRTIDLPGLPPASPLICYEAIFPGEVADPAHRPSWLLNVTNDAWFGDSAGPYQHFANVRTRAVEEGLPLVRSANNGISAVVDPLGRVAALLDLDRIGVLDAELPAPLPPTPYARAGDGILAAILLLLLPFGFRWRR